MDSAVEDRPSVRLNAVLALALALALAVIVVVAVTSRLLATPKAGLVRPGN